MVVSIDGMAVENLHEGFVASVGRTHDDPDRHWLVIGDYQTLYAAQLAVEKHMIWRGR